MFWLFSENSMKKFKEKISDGLPSPKNEIHRCFPWNFPKIEHSYHAAVQKNSVKNGSVVHFEQKVQNLVRNVSQCM